MNIVYFLSLFSLIDCLSTKKYLWLDQISRQELLNKECMFIKNQNISSNYTNLDHILVDHKHKLLYCYVPKIACTNWKRVMMVLSGVSNETKLVNIPSNMAHAENSTLRLSQLNPEEAQKCLSTYTTFLMVRHPMERLLSAYRNKFEGNNTSSRYFQSRYGQYIIKKYRKNSKKRKKLPLGSDVSINEFVKYLIDEGPQTNEHWTPIYNLCQPCHVNYTFIGKYEHLSEDTEALFNLINASNLIFPQTSSAHTNSKIRAYFQQLPIEYMKRLYQLYRNDFILFDYNLESILGFDFG